MAAPSSPTASPEEDQQEVYRPAIDISLHADNAGDRFSCVEELFKIIEFKNDEQLVAALKNMPKIIVNLNRKIWVANNAVRATKLTCIDISYTGNICLKHLTKHSNHFGTTLLQLAIHVGYQFGVTTLVNEGADLHYQSNHSFYTWTERAKGRVVIPPHVRIWKPCYKRAMVDPVIVAMKYTDKVSEDDKDVDKYKNEIARLETIIQNKTQHLESLEKTIHVTNKNKLLQQRELATKKRELEGLDEDIDLKKRCLMALTTEELNKVILSFNYFTEEYTSLIIRLSEARSKILGVHELILDELNIVNVQKLHEENQRLRILNISARETYNTLLRLSQPLQPLYMTNVSIRNLIGNTPPHEMSLAESFEIYDQLLLLPQSNTFMVTAREIIDSHLFSRNFGTRS